MAWNVQDIMDILVNFQATILSNEILLSQIG